MCLCDAHLLNLKDDEKPLPEDLRAMLREIMSYRIKMGLYDTTRRSEDPRPDPIRDQVLRG